MFVCLCEKNCKEKIILLNMRMMKGLKFHKGIFPLIWVKAWKIKGLKIWKCHECQRGREEDELFREEITI